MAKQYIVIYAVTQIYYDIIMNFNNGMKVK